MPSDRYSVDEYTQLRCVSHVGFIHVVQLNVAAPCQEVVMS